MHVFIQGLYDVSGSLKNQVSVVRLPGHAHARAKWSEGLRVRAPNIAPKIHPRPSKNESDLAS